MKGLIKSYEDSANPTILFGNAQSMPIDSSSIDLIITSPPYASNAIDYMRAHKFSLVWLGYKLSHLSQKRGKYIGGEGFGAIPLNGLPVFTTNVIKDIMEMDKKKGNSIHRYYCEMVFALKEMYRVLKPGKTAIVVVGSSVMRGRDTETHHCLIDIGKSIGFEVPYLGVRKLDRNRRMMPASFIINQNSQIQQRMHEEYVLGLWKPYSY